ncbi:MAG: SLC13 family permease [Planctomycetota bacterium]|jgi:di/tricarboxylate transporter
MTLEAWYTVFVVGAVIGALVTNRIGADVAMLGGLTLLLLGDAVLPGGIIDVPEAVQGFAHPAVLMIGSLFVVAAGLQETGGMEAIAQFLLGRPKTILRAQVRLMVPVALMSALMNNTPIVAMYLPIVNDWSKRLGFSPSKLYMPLSFAAILGGKLTYIGTASNIIVLGMYAMLLQDAANTEWLAPFDLAPMTGARQFWSVALLGVPTTIAGIAFVVLASRWLLPARKPVPAAQIDARQYQVDMEVRPDSPIIGKTIEQAGLRHLPGLFLSEIERDGHVLAAVAPDERLQAGDRLGFVGILDSVVDLRKIRGLVPATDQIEKITGDRRTRTLVEAVVAHTSPLVGVSVRASQFRTKFNAAIIAVHRDGQQIKRKIGDIVLQPGDTLLLDTHGRFLEAYRHSRSFHLVSRVEGSRPIRHERAGIALAVLAIMVGLFVFTSLDKVIVALMCGGLMVFTRCVTGTEARRAVNLQVLIVIAAALGMGSALENTGAATAIADGMIELLSGTNARIMLLAIFTIAVIFAQIITIYGSAVLMFPIAMEAARNLEVSPEPFVFTLIVAAGSTFVTPIGYQTNLMVYGPGGYRFLDFFRLGFPLTIVIAGVVTLLAPVIFPFHAAT